MTTKIEFLKENFSDLKLPDKCHACSKPSPDSILNITPIGGAIVPLNEDVSKGWPLSIPACKGCKMKIWLGRWIASILFVISSIFVLLILWITNMIFANLGTAVNVVLMLILISAGIIITPKIYTPPLEVEPFDDRLLFYYKDDSLGEEFAKLNGITEIFDHLNQPKNFLQV